MPDQSQTVFDDILDLTLAREPARRPTLVRVLVDGFVRDESVRTPTEIKQFEALMLALLPQVDAFTRAVAAQKLARRVDAPPSVIDLLARDEEAVAEPIRAHSPVFAASARAPVTIDAKPIATTRAAPSVAAPAAKAPVPARAADPTAKRRPRGSFFDASSAARRSLLAHLSMQRPGGKTLDRPVDLGRNLVRLAILRQTAALVETLSRALGVPQPLARAILEDPSGEPLVIAARALDLSEDVLSQLFILAVPSIGQDYRAVAALRDLFLAVSAAAATAILARLAEDNRADPAQRPAFMGERVAHSTETPTPARPAEPRRTFGLRFK